MWMPCWILSPSPRHGLLGFVEKEYQVSWTWQLSRPSNWRHGPSVGLYLSGSKMFERDHKTLPIPDPRSDTIDSKSETTESIVFIYWLQKLFDIKITKEHKNWELNLSKSFYPSFKYWILKQQFFVFSWRSWCVSWSTLLPTSCSPRFPGSRPGGCRRRWPGGRGWWTTCHLQSGPGPGWWSPGASSSCWTASIQGSSCQYMAFK